MSGSIEISGEEYSDLQAQISQLEQECGNLRLRVRACLKFMEYEMGWEDFREEMLSHDDEPQQNTHRENIRKLKNFLVEQRADGEN